MLWDLGCELATQYYNAWNICVRLAWQVPRATHTYFLDHLLSCGLISSRVDILARYAKFIRGLKVSPSMEVSVMFGVAKRDIRTVTGSNIALLASETGLDPAQACMVHIKERLMSKTSSVPDRDRWRLDFLAKLLVLRGEALYSVDDKEVQRLSGLIDSLCIN